MSIKDINSPYKGSGSLTRAQFLFYEMRTTAKLLCEGLNDEEIKGRIVSENLFQYPTERSLLQMTRVCLHRLHGLNDEALVCAIAQQDFLTAKQICLYAMMREYRLVWDFMVTVIGAKYRQQDYSYSRRDINVFFMQLQEQDDYVASWSESTCKRIKAELSRLLVENEYIEDGKANKLQPVLLSMILENSIRSNGDVACLPAFNCFS